MRKIHEEEFYINGEKHTVKVEILGSMMTESLEIQGQEERLMKYMEMDK